MKIVFWFVLTFVVWYGSVAFVMADINFLSVVMSDAWDVTSRGGLLLWLWVVGIWTGLGINCLD